MLATMKDPSARAPWAVRALVVLGATAVLALPAVYLSTTSGVLADDAKRRDGKGPSAEFLPPVTQSEQKILDRLEEETSMDFHEAPLQDAVDYLHDLHDIQIQLDTKSLEEADIGTDTPLTCRVNGVTLKSGLRLVLRSQDLAYIIKDEVLLITTADAAKEALITRTYPVGDLVGDDPPDFQALVHAVTTVVRPKSWDEVGGAGSITEVPRAQSLVVSQTREVHDDVLELLRSLRAARKKSGGGPAPGKRLK